MTGFYSPDGQTEGCVAYPQGYKARERGATSADQCTGMTIIEVSCSEVYWICQTRWIYFECTSIYLYDQCM